MDAQDPENNNSKTVLQQTSEVQQLLTRTMENVRIEMHQSQPTFAMEMMQHSQSISLTEED